MGGKTVINLVDRSPWVCGDCKRISNLLKEHSWTSPWILPKVLDSVLRGIAQVCFANNPFSGLLVLTGLFTGDVRAGGAAILCSLVAIATAKFIKEDDGAISAGLTNFSAVLVGTVTSTLYPLFYTRAFGVDIWLYMIAAAVFSVCVGCGLGVIIGKHNLPAFTLPFNVATSVTFLCLQAKGYADPVQAVDPVSNITISSSETLQYDVEETIQWSQVWLGSLLSAGQVYAVESVACSVLILVGLLFCSPIIAITSYAGGLLASFAALAVSSSPYTAIYTGVWGYNGFLSAGCLSFFMVPSPKILVMVVINAIFTTFLQAALIPVFSANNLPVFTFPFCLSSLLFLALTTNVGLDSERVASPTYPEQHLALYLERQATDDTPKVTSYKERNDQHPPDDGRQEV